MNACRRVAVVSTLTVLVLGAGTPVAGAQDRAGEPPPTLAAPLAWAACGLSEEAVGVECATADLPMDYDEPGGERVQVAVARIPAADPAKRIGSLFFNFGGPGGPAVDYLQAAGAGVFASLNQRFDIVGFDPRGVGQSTPAIDCQVDQETQGIYSVPVPTPLDIDVDAYLAKVQGYVDACLANNGEILEHVSTANVARDMDVLRAALGEERLNYIGFSYGTFLGATYASLFPDRYRAMVLDGALDADEYINDPFSSIATQTAALETALARFTEACAVDQVACSGFGGADPYLAYDQLLAAAETAPIQADAYTPDPRPVTADDIRTVTVPLLYSKQSWGLLGLLLAEAAAGEGSTIRAVLDQFVYTDDPGADLYFTIGASEQRYPQGDLDVYLDRGAESWASFPHFWSNSGYAEIAYALWPAHDEDAFAGPFDVPETSPTPLVIGTTYDPATPYSGAVRLVADLGNARLLTMEGDGHTAYGGNSACIDAAAGTYLIDGLLPAEGTVCQQEVPFVAGEPVPVEASTATQRLGRPIGR
ncbi:alpha/beta hydrolase [Geodermatophilus sp. DSM 45219]|uniref:alpha/beta hydrolase n=1 Tax=Geodermatophilus sp. DSM 45219 TaxID=1881103 RepID=UPI000890DBBC|nr:alpha/beta hydrolase [Geodermatophilus sp. DSM 45219]SDN72956.1 alpha/beta hydrolase fold [Geodermatophilus sp. DSM 45219]